MPPSSPRSPLPHTPASTTTNRDGIISFAIAITAALDAPSRSELAPEEDGAFKRNALKPVTRDR